MHVPAEVESGSVPFVILDCDYDLAESESNQVRLHSRFDFFLETKRKKIEKLEICNLKFLITSFN